IALLGEASVAAKLLGWTPLKQQFGRVHEETQSSSKQFSRGGIIIRAPFHEQFNHFCFLPHIGFRQSSPAANVPHMDVGPLFQEDGHYAGVPPESSLKKRCPTIKVLS